MLFLVLSPYDNEQSDLIHRVSEEKTLEEIPLYRYAILFVIRMSVDVHVMVSINPGVLQNSSF